MRNKLRNYRLFKTNFSYEPYLNKGNRREQKRLLSKLRISDHSLELEKGRYIGIEVKDRFCKICKNQVEDEKHFLLECKYLEEHRKTFINKINIKYKNFKHLSSLNKFIWLMSSEDNIVIRGLQQLNEQLYVKRNELLVNLNV